MEDPGGAKARRMAWSEGLEGERSVSGGAEERALARPSAVRYLAFGRGVPVVAGTAGEAAEGPGPARGEAEEGLQWLPRVRLRARRSQGKAALADGGRGRHPRHGEGEGGGMRKAAALQRQAIPGCWDVS